MKFGLERTTNLRHFRLLLWALSRGEFTCILNRQWKSQRQFAGKQDSMRIYLDNCTLNRPFDDQSQIRIRIESEAKLYIQEKIRNGSLHLIWSYIVDFESSQNPFAERRNAIQKWRDVAVDDIEESEEIIRIANGLTNIGIKAKDALHVACAVVGGAEYFLTTDDGILKKLVSYNRISVLSPTEFIKILEGES